MQIAGIPAHISPTHVESILREIVEEYSLGNIVAVAVVPDLKEIEEIVKEKRIVEEEIGEETGARCWKGSKEYYIHRRIVLESTLRGFRGKFIEKNAGFGFVLCKQPMIAEYIIKAFEGKESFGVGVDTWTMSEAPYYDDIIWRNPPNFEVFSIFQRIFWNTLFILLFLIFFTPLELAGIIADAVTIFNFPNNINSFITLSLPSVAISVFYSVIIPIAIRFLTEKERNHLYSKVSTSAFTKYILYSIGIMIFFPLLGAVTLDKLIEKLLNLEITKWSLSLITNITLVGEFFVNFLVSIGLGSNFLDLLLTNQYFTSNFYIYRRSYEEKTAPVFDFTYEYSRVLIILCVILVFSVAMPVILPFGCLFMTIKYWIDKYNLLYVYRVEPTAGKSLQGIVLVFLLVVLGVSQMVNSGLFMASGSKLLVGFGAVLAAAGVISVAVAVGIYQYWNSYHLSRPDEINAKDLYMHPYLKFLEYY